MNEKERLNNQLFKHMKYNLLAFATIFVIFGIFIFITVSKITYSAVDKELIDAIDEFEIVKINYGINSRDIFKNPSNLFNQENLFNQRDYILAKKITNPKIVCILRDEKFRILNIEDLGRNYENYFENMEFDSENLNNIYEINFENKYFYRGINLKIDSENEKDRYIQLFINIDSEKVLISNYFQIIVSAVLFEIMLAVIASYILSKKTLNPVQETLEKQIEFVENVSHELRTPLTIIQAKQELLLQEPNSKIIDKSEEISLTLEETKRLTKLTKDLLLLSKADNKQFNLNLEEVEIDKLIENIVNPYIELGEVQEKNINLDLKFDNIISVDVNKIQQLIIILLDNAIKYTESGDSITISTSLKDNKCIIEIKDTGIGISDEGLKKVFDRFYREDKARNRETGGSGLGLAIAHSIVKAHNGNIKANHNNPKGTIFSIKLNC